MQAAGKRYQQSKGILKMSCDRHRAREDNRRQALHWVLRLVETALLTFPSEEWEALKRRQLTLLEEVIGPAPLAGQRTANAGASNVAMANAAAPQ